MTSQLGQNFYTGNGPHVVDGRFQSPEFVRANPEFEKKFDGQDVPRPPFWSGFRLEPDAIEFWTGKPSRLHERQLFIRDDEGWRVQRLYP